MLSPLDLSLINGPIPVTATVAGVLALVALAIRKNRTWWTRIVPAVVLACTAATAGLKLLVDHVWKPWPEPLPPILAVWAGAALLAVCLAVARLRAGRWYWRLLSAVLVLVVMTSSVTAANAYFGFYSTSRAVLELLTNNRVDLDDAAKPASSVIEVPAGGKLADVWQKPADLPEKGTVSEAPWWCCCRVSPVRPRDWFDAGRLTGRLDAFAREHDGLAPIVVVADQLGARMANPLCLDSKLGQSETYLAREVPEWIKRRLTVDERREAWTIAGLSQGGTCAVQLAVRAPDVYGNFINLTGQREQTPGSRAETVKAAFGGDEAAFVRVNPMDILARERFPQTAGVIVAGRDDVLYRQADAEMFEACRRAGIDVLWKELAGGHDWNVGDPGLYDSLPWLASRTGLSR